MQQHVRECGESVHGESQDLRLILTNGLLEREKENALGFIGHYSHGLLRCTLWVATSVQRGCGNSRPVAAAARTVHK